MTTPSRLFSASSVVAFTLAFAPMAAGCTADRTSGEAMETGPATTVMSTSTVEPTTGRIDVTMGHCYVEPVRFDGEWWNVPFERQFGWGGLQPKDWQGSGTMTRLGDARARFADDGGASVIFRPVEDPSVRIAAGAFCD